MRLTIVILFCCPIFCAHPGYAQCKKVPDNVKPNLGNEYIELTGIKVPQLVGKVLLPDGTPENEAVVEVYKYPKEKNFPSMNVPYTQKRIAACLTGEDGRFLFTKIKPGKYLLRAGVWRKTGFDPINVILIVDPKTKIKGDNPLDLFLHISL